MKIYEAIDMKGRLTLRLTDKNGKTVQQLSSDNDIVRTGRDLVAKLFANVAVAPVSHIAVGTGTTAVNPASNVALENELFRKAIKEIDPAVDITDVTDKKRVIVSTELDFAEGNGALTEAGIFNSEDPAASIMYNRVVFPPVNKTADFKLTFLWEILF